MSPNEIIGTIGVGMILIAYFLNIYTLIKKEGVLFFTLNIIGGLIACIASILIRFWPFIILEGTWTMVSIFGLLKNIKKPQE
jgi:nucleoside recognition membrane protein YjiH